MLLKRNLFSKKELFTTLFICVPQRFPRSRLIKPTPSKNLGSNPALPCLSSFPISNSFTNAKHAIPPSLCSQRCRTFALSPRDLLHDNYIVVVVSAARQFPPRLPARPNRVLCFVGRGGNQRLRGRRARRYDRRRRRRARFTFGTLPSFCRTPPQPFPKYAQDVL